MEILCFFAGVALVFLKSAFSAYFILIVLFFRTRFRFVIWFITGVLWAYLHQSVISSRDLSFSKVVNYAQVQGYIASIPKRELHKTQFQFFADRMDGRPVHALLLLSCFDEHCPNFKVGQYWQMMAKLKMPSNYNNPGGFDYVSGLKARHISRIGYIQKGRATRLKSEIKPYPLLALREYLAKSLEFKNPDEKTLGIMQALTLGLTQYIDKEEWDLFRRTGTTHLMVISGAHIGLVAGLVYLGAKWLWCRLGRLCLRYPAPKVAGVIAFIIALIYALLAGFGVPTQRALIVCFFMCSRHFFSQRMSPWQAWRYALLIVLIFEPHSVLFPGFYLSFMAVAILISMNERISWDGIRKTLSLQMCCAFGLMPLTLFWFSYGSVNGFAANLLAIPWVSFVIVPMGLIQLICGTWIDIPGFLFSLKMAIRILMTYLSWIDSFAMVNLEWSFAHIFTPMMLMVVSGMAIFMPIKRLLLAGIILTIAGSMPAQENIAKGRVVIDVLDVGQGLSVVARTAKHTLIYDTGIKFYQGSDMGKIVIIPYLNTIGVKVIDKVVISHPDLDHRGGLASLEEKFTIGEFLVDNPAFYHRGVSCHQYPAWIWDGVAFQFFPIAGSLNSKNNTSCVLKISTKSGQILLTGDIETQAERYLVDKYRKQLASTVMVIPHHGSKTSSSYDFVAHVAPQYAVVSYGFDNHYHFPHQQAMQVYQDRGISVYNTAECGMVRVLLDKEKEVYKPTCYHKKSNDLSDILPKLLYNLRPLLY